MEISRPNGKGSDIGTSVVIRYRHGVSYIDSDLNPDIGVPDIVSDIDTDIGNVMPDMTR